TSPALSRVCASLIAGDGLPDDVARQGVSLDDLTPHRLRNVSPEASKVAS
ncbi:FAD-dependent oxidoreductase, partial [Mesorhizobium sp. M2C.T.Ca.TU.009.01.2.1]